MKLLDKLEKNMYDRAKILCESNKSDEMKYTLVSICKKDPIYFFKYFLFTDRNPICIPEKYGNVVPFILYKYQEEFITDCWESIQMGQLPINERTKPTDIFSEKSRQMWFSWLFAGLQLYAYLFHNLKSLYISKKSD